MSIIGDIKRDLSELKSGKKELRGFGIVFFVVLGIIGALRFWKGHGDWFYLAAASFAFLLISIALPKAFKPLYPIWMTFSLTLGWFMNRVILTITFILMFTTIGLVLKLMRKDLLELKLKPEDDTYWKKVTSMSDRERFRRPY